MALPLPGPLHADPTGVVSAACGPVRSVADLSAPMRRARGMLRTALLDVELGPWDERIVAWLDGWDVSVVATVASLLRRAFEAGQVLSRVETGGDVRAAIAGARLVVDDETAEARQALSALVDRLEQVRAGAVPDDPCCG
jgi:hypothetical protein